MRSQLSVHTEKAEWGVANDRATLRVVLKQDENAPISTQHDFLRWTAFNLGQAIEKKYFSSNSLLRVEE